MRSIRAQGRKKIEEEYKDAEEGSEEWTAKEAALAEQSAALQAAMAALADVYPDLDNGEYRKVMTASPDYSAQIALVEVRAEVRYAEAAAATKGGVMVRAVIESDGEATQKSCLVIGETVYPFRSTGI